MSILLAARAEQFPERTAIVAHPDFAPLVAPLATERGLRFGLTIAALDHHPPSRRSSRARAADKSSEFLGGHYV